MPRPRKTPLAPVEETPTPAPETAEAPIRRRRRRRTTTPPDYAAETQTVVEAVLRGRGSKGVTGDMLGKVVAWARQIRVEGDSLKELSARPRRAKTQAPADRVSSYDMNRALLDGVLSGTIALDVTDDGTLVFLDASSTAPAASSPVPEE